MPLSTEWIKTTPQDRRAGFEEAVRNSVTALGRLYELLDEWEEELNRAETKLADFESPNWAVKQAYRNGDRSRIRKLRDLLSFLKGD
jgi:hypothetical protein